MIGGGIAFYPTLAYNLFRNYIQPTKWSWYSRVNDTLILGAIPFSSMLEVLKNEEGVGGVVCCTEQFELDAAWGAIKPKEWINNGIEFHHTPMKDFFGTTSQKDMTSAVEFIERITNQGKTCYIHCKAGRTRSATVAVCYLMYKYGQNVEEAKATLSKQRPQILLHEVHMQTANEFRQHLDLIKEGKN